MPLSPLSDLVTRFADARVLCVGDVMLDRFVNGTVSRISPEAPIPVLHVREETAMPGGAGNVVRNLVALGAQVVFCAAVGEDDAGRELELQLQAEGRVTNLMIRDASRCTGRKTRFVAHAQQLLRADEETIRALTLAQVDELRKMVEAHLPNVDVLVLSDYGKGLLDAGVSTMLIDLARAAGKPVIVDPKGRDYARYAGADLVTPNRQELSEASGMPVDTDDQVVAASKKLLDDNAFGAVLATRSQDGMSLIRADGSVVHMPTDAREVYDVSGAGDTVLATLAAAISVGASREEAARLANRAAGIAVGRVGTATVPADALLASLRHDDWSEVEAQVVDTEEAGARIARWRRQGKTIGFTNGCFDLLHPGHISLLNQAKAACDRLVVGLNADVSVRRLKGETRPVQSETARATVLASLACVDLVVLFSEDTPIELIRRLKPDVLIKGADYTEQTVVGADIVKAYGGKLFLAKLEEGHSTTETLRRYRNKSTA